MQIKVKLFATLRKFGPVGLEIGESFLVQGKLGWTINNLIQSLKIPSELAKIIMVDGIHRKHDYPIPETGALIAIFPPIGGGYTSNYPGA